MNTQVFNVMIINMVLIKIPIICADIGCVSGVAQDNGWFSGAILNLDAILVRLGFLNTTKKHNAINTPKYKKFLYKTYCDCSHINHGSMISDPILLKYKWHKQQHGFDAKILPIKHVTIIPANNQCHIFSGPGDNCCLAFYEFEIW